MSPELPAVARSVPGCRRLSECTTAVAARLAAASHVMLGLDYDGTLTPHVDDPNRAILGPDVRANLRALAARPKVTIAVVSGRALEDVRQLVGIEGLIYAGNHGLQIVGPDFHYIEASAAADRGSLSALAQTLAAQLQTYAGSFVENKGLTLSVHYRLVAVHLRDGLRRTVEGAVENVGHCFQLRKGNNVLEIRPQVDWHKGRALQWIQDRPTLQDALAIYIGDDETDEDGFTALPDGITIKVGDPSKTSAQFHVDTPDDVREFLEWLERTALGGRDGRTLALARLGAIVSPHVSLDSTDG